MSVLFEPAKLFVTGYIAPQQITADTVPGWSAHKVPLYNLSIGVLPSLALNRLSKATISGSGYRTGSTSVPKFLAKASGAIAVIAASEAAAFKNVRRDIYLSSFSSNNSSSFMAVPSFHKNYCSLLCGDLPCQKGSDPELVFNMGGSGLSWVPPPGAWQAKFGWLLHRCFTRLFG